MAFEFSAPSNRLVQVYVLAKEVGIATRELKLAAEVILEESDRGGNFPAEKSLLQPGFEGTILFRLQVRTCHSEGSGKRLVQRGCLDAGSVGEAQTRSGKCFSAAQ